MKGSLSECTIRGIALDEKTTSPFVLLYSKEGRTILPIQVGPSEAGAIILELEQVKPELPGTWDFMEMLFKDHRLSVKQLEIYRREGDRYHSRIVYRKGLRTYKQEIKAADGIVMSIKFGAPILIHPSILEFGRREEELLSPEDSQGTEMLYLEPESTSISLM
jgi:bifunctional DNase/RNase